MDCRPIVGNNFNWLWQGLSIAWPFFAAFGLGMFLGRLKTSSYLLLGFVAGLVGFAQMLLLFALGRMYSALQYATDNHSVYVFAIPPKWQWSLLSYPISGALLFLSGGRLGERIRNSRSVIPGVEPTVGPARVVGIENWLTMLAPYFAAILTFLAIFFWPEESS